MLRRTVSSLARTDYLEVLAGSLSQGAAIVRDYRRGKTDPALLVTVEHATNSLPGGYSFQDQSLTKEAGATLLENSHWGWDPGALETADKVARAAGGVLVAAAYSRLLIDPNRPLPSDTLIRRSFDGIPITLNIDVDHAELTNRVNKYYSPFHTTMGAVKAEIAPVALLSIHSFSPTYPGMAPGSRDFEAGVLYTFDDALAEAFR